MHVFMATSRSYGNCASLSLVLQCGVFHLHGHMLDCWLGVAYADGDGHFIGELLLFRYLFIVSLFPLTRVTQLNPLSLCGILALLLVCSTERERRCDFIGRGMVRTSGADGAVLDGRGVVGRDGPVCRVLGEFSVRERCTQ